MGESAVLPIKIALSAVASGALAVALAPAAAASTSVADWEMTDSPGASTMADSSGNGLDGSVGSTVKTGVHVPGALGFGFRFPFAGHTTLDPGRLVTVADDSPSSNILNPGTRDFAITWRMRTRQPFGNIIQKGQSATPGGYFKIQAPNGIVQCLFRGAGGSRAVGSGQKLNDGAWHTITCRRSSTGVTMTVDGRAPRSSAGPTGTISNRFPLSIGGKVSCNQTTVSCDYYVGDLDYVRIANG
jgi:hypothetical protein